MCKVAAMLDNPGVDEKVSDTELIVLLRKAQEEIEAHGQLNELSSCYATLR
jgi:hypothetical protein